MCDALLQQWGRVRRSLIKTTAQLTAQLAWLIRGSVGTKACSPLHCHSVRVSLSLLRMSTDPLALQRTCLSLKLGVDHIIPLNRGSRFWLQRAWSRDRSRTCPWAQFYLPILHTADSTEIIPLQPEGLGQASSTVHLETSRSTLGSWIMEMLGIINSNYLMQV